MKCSRHCVQLKCRATWFQFPPYRCIFFVIAPLFHGDGRNTYLLVKTDLSCLFVVFITFTASIGADSLSMLSLHYVILFSVNYIPICWQPVSTLDEVRRHSRCVKSKVKMKLFTFHTTDFYFGRRVIVLYCVLDDSFILPRYFGNVLHNFRIFWMKIWSVCDVICNIYLQIDISIIVIGKVELRPSNVVLEKIIEDDVEVDRLEMRMLSKA